MQDPGGHQGIHPRNRARDCESIVLNTVRLADRGKRLEGERTFGLQQKKLWQEPSEIKKRKDTASKKAIRRETVSFLQADKVVEGIRIQRYAKQAESIEKFPSIQNKRGITCGKSEAKNRVQERGKRLCRLKWGVSGNINKFKSQ